MNSACLRIALAQVTTGPEREENVTHALRMMADASQAGAQLIVFPEMSVDRFFPQYRAEKGASLTVDLMAEVGFFGYTPVPGDPFIFSFRNIPTSTMLTDAVTVLGSLVGEAGDLCIGVLGAGQVDRYGNVNSTCIPEMKLWLVGSGGACDVATGARELIVTIPMNKLRCVDKVSYVTAPGERVKAVVTDLGIFEKPPGEDALVLTACYATSGFAGRDEALEAIAGKCGWELKAADILEVLEPPTPDELKDIRIFDPRRYFLEE